ncbi:MAG: GIY-YIG nuclease family protein [Nitrospirota bacterium]
MSFHVYILRSDTTGRHYCGHTDDLVRRLRQHNDPGYQGTKTTKRFPGPWTTIWSVSTKTRAEAMNLEKKIKARGIQRFLKDP